MSSADCHSLPMENSAGIVPLLPSCACITFNILLLKAEFLVWEAAVLIAQCPFEAIGQAYPNRPKPDFFVIFIFAWIPTQGSVALKSIMNQGFCKLVK